VPTAFRPDLSWEFLSADEIEAKSIRALRNHVKHVKEVSPYYRAALAEVNADEITSLEAFRDRVPCTTKERVVEHVA
jgi:phenylacetate-coenzyme A ligase PaaK-like adenylate-forming protein